MISIITITVLVLAETVRMETSDEINQYNITDFKTHVAVDIQKECGHGTKPCVIKCCAENEVLFKVPYQTLYTCRNLKALSKEYTPAVIQELSDYSNIINSNNIIVSFFEDFRILYSDRFVNKPHSIGPVFGIIHENGLVHAYPYKNNPLIMIKAVIPDFCMDKIMGLSPDDSGRVIATYAQYFRVDDPKTLKQTTTFLAYGGVVSAFFLLLVFVIHYLLKFLHANLNGKLLMRFVFSLMIYFVYSAWYNFSTLEGIENPETNGNILPACRWVSPFGYYMFVSSFFWLNAMCYDIWRKFRSSKLKGSKSDDKKKMRLYSAYALGMPLLCTVISLLMDQYGSEQVRPDFDNCMRDDENCLWKRLYVRLPMSLVVLSNVVMWVLTLRNLRRVRVEFARTARKESTHTRKGEKLSNVYGKLFILMGVNWMIEMVMMPFAEVPSWVFYLMTVPNTLLGVWTFFVTVFKKKIFQKLCRRFGIVNQWAQNINTTHVSLVTSTTKAKAYNKNKNTDNDMA